MKYRSTILLLPICVMLQTACSSQAVYTGESFDTDSPFQMRVDDDVALACESARRSLLGQGYLIDTASGEGVKGRKAYKNEDAQSTFIEMNIVCLPETQGSTLFATGLLTTYALKKSTSSASVGLSALGSISLPIGQSADSLVKVSEETIDDKDFYGRFFAAVGTILKAMESDKAPPEPLVEPAVPEPIPATGAPPMAPDPALLELVPPEPGPAQDPAVPTKPLPVEMAPAAVLEPFPVPATPAAVLEPFPVPATPAAVLEPFPVRAKPANAEPVASPNAPAAVLEPFPVRTKPASSKPAPSPAAPAIVEEPTLVPAQEVPTTTPERGPDPVIELF